jgi:hypothetical protein
MLKVRWSRAGRTTDAATTRSGRATSAQPSFFGPNATFSCFENSSDCKFNFNCTAARHQALLLRHWQDKGKGAGTMLHEGFHGDIGDS